MVLSSSLLPAGVRLDENSVFQLLKKTGRDWDNVADNILRIDSKEKRDEIRNRFSSDDDRLRESIRFWLKRNPFSSYRWLAYQGVSTEFVEPLPGKNEAPKYMYKSLALVPYCVVGKDPRSCPGDLPV